MDELISKLLQKLKEMHETSKQRHITFCELYSDDHPIEF